jgi:hypothetical protein
METSKPERRSAITDSKGKQVTLREIGERSLAFIQSEDAAGNIVRNYCTVGRQIRTDVELPDWVKQKQAEAFAVIDQLKQDVPIDPELTQ